MAEIFSVKSGVKYSKDSIVSKQILNKKAGTVTLFAFDKGQALSEHKAPFDAIAQVVEGTALITINREQHKVKMGQFVIMPANVVHAVTAREKFKMLLTMIKD
jgi:quercetin dioxygenase-like cupin family protein